MNTKKIALITGANKGIGLETARQLAAQGMHVLLGAREAANGEAAAKKIGGDVEPLTIDVTNLESIRAAVRTVEERFGRLDVLINNAGVMLDDHGKKTSEQSLDVWRKTIETNLFGVIAVTQAFLPLLRKSDSGRIVNLSSILGSNTLHLDPASPIYGNNTVAYDVSKSALNAWTVHLAHELKETSIKVNAAHPGWVKTDMGGAEAPLEVGEGARTSVALAMLGDDGPTGAFVHQGQELPW